MMNRSPKPHAPRLPGGSSSGPVAGAFAVAIGLALSLALAACENTEKTLRYKPFFSGLSDPRIETRFGTQPVTDSPVLKPIDPGAGADNRIRITSDDGKLTLISRAPVHVMSHVQTCLDNGEFDELFEQIVAESTKSHFRSQGKDPRTYLEFLKDNEKNIAKLFSRMPQGENSPSAVLRQLPDRVWRIDVTGAFAKDLELTRLWVQMERGSWKLMWID
jgi:hypothetical protein